jgi:hypothetical protein
VGKNAVLEAGLLLEAVARKIRRHNGKFSTLEFQIIRLHIETALSMLPNPPGSDVSTGGDSVHGGGATPARRPKP